MQHPLAPVQYRGQLSSPPPGESFLVTRLPSGEVQYQPIPQNPQTYPQYQPQPQDPIASVLGLTAIAVLGIGTVGFFCFVVGYSAGERSNARVLVCQTQSESGFFWSHTNTNCR